MLRWILILLVLALLFSAVGATALGHALANIAWLIFVVLLVLLVINLLSGRASTRV